MSSSLEQGDDETARAALECLIELVEFCPHFFEHQLEHLLAGMFKVAADVKWEEDILPSPPLRFPLSPLSSLTPDAPTRHSALEFFVTLCEAKPSLVRKQLRSLEQFVSLMLRMMTEIEENSHWNEGQVSLVLGLDVDSNSIDASG